MAFLSAHMRSFGRQRDGGGVLNLTQAGQLAVGTARGPSLRRGGASGTRFGGAGNPPQIARAGARRCAFI